MKKTVLFLILILFAINSCSQNDNKTDFNFGFERISKSPVSTPPRKPCSVLFIGTFKEGNRNLTALFEFTTCLSSFLLSGI